MRGATLDARGFGVDTKFVVSGITAADPESLTPHHMVSDQVTLWQ